MKRVALVSRPSGVQRKGAVPRARGRDKYEQQADALAQRFVRGEHGLGTDITPRPAAGFTLPTSRGEPLPRALRHDLEQAFDAELGAVRVHRDSAAGAAAAGQRAHAFASGGALFFGAGRFDAATDTGRELIAHEIVHALQQTGRTAGDGRMAVSPARGDAVPQCDVGLTDGQIDAPGFPGTIRSRHLEGATEDLETFIAVRFRNIPSGGRLSEVAETDDESLIAQAQRARQGNLAAGRAGAEEEPVPGQPRGRTHSLRAQGVLLDLLKGVGAVTQSEQRRGMLFRTALDLLRSEPRIPSAFICRSFFGFVANTAPFSELLNAVHGDRDTGSFWPEGFIGEIRRFLFTPTQAVRPLPRLEAAATRLDQQSQTRQSLGNNELVHAGLFHLRALDQFRVDQFRDMEQRARHAFPDESPLVRRVRVADQVDRWGQQIAANPRGTVSREAAAFIGQRISETARHAYEVWVRAGQREQGFERAMEGVDIETLFDIEEGARGRFLHQRADDALTRDPMAASLRDDLSRELAEFFALADDGTLPAAPQMVAQRRRLRTSLRRQSESLSEGLLGLVTGERPNVTRIDGIAWLIAWLNNFQQHLDHAVAGGDSALSAIDGRRALRIRAANWVGSFAVFMGWRALADDARAVLLAEEFDADGGLASTLALVSDWELEPNRPLADMLKDFEGSFDTGAAPIIADTPITLRNLIHFFQARYLEQLRGTLQTFLADSTALEREATQRRRPKSFIQRALEAAHAVPRPERYQVRDFAYAIAPSERDLEQGLSRELILAHPKTQRFFSVTGTVEGTTQHTTSSRRADPDWGSVIVPKARFDEVFAWVIVDLRPLVLAMRPVAQILGLPVPADVAVVAADRLWLRTLSEMPGVREAIDGLFDADVRRQQEGIAGATPDLVTLLRRATTLERRVVARRLSEFLGSYSTSRTPLDAPEQALRQIEAFSQQILPAEESAGSETVSGPRDDRAPQLAALLLGIAPRLRSGLGSRPPLDRTFAWYGNVALAIESVEDAGRRARVREVLADDEDPAALMGSGSDQGLGAMRELLEALDRSRTASRERFGFETVEGNELRGVNNAMGVGLGSRHAFTLDGTRFEFVRIHRAFVYHPAVGHPGEPGYLASTLTDERGADIDRNTTLPLLTILRDAVQITVTSNASWDFLLNELSYVVEMRGRVLQLEQLARDIQAFEELLMEGVELIPGAGQAVMAARIVAGVLQMIASGEFDDIRTFLRSGLAARIRDMAEFLGERLLRPDTIFHFLIGGESTLLDRLAGPPAEAGKSRRAVTASRGKLARLFQWIRSLGRKIARGIRSLRDLIRHPIEAFQAFVFNRPLLELALTVISQVLIALASMRLERFASLSDLREGLENGRSTLHDRLQQALDSLSKVELPGEILPMQLVVSIVADQLLRRLGGLKVRLIVRFLQLTGVWNRVTAIVADALTDAGVDPNVLWRDLVLNRVKTQFEEAKNDLVDGVYGALDAVGQRVGMSFTRPVPSPVDVQEIPFPRADVDDDTDPKPEAELKPVRPGAVPHAPHPPMPVLGSGFALPLATRLDAERRFGHDFSHVRTHTAGPAAAYADGLGAQALTSGSHIVLASGTPPASGPLLDHELAHVLQQTGGRPLGRSYQATPIAGRRGPGVVLDPAREAAADRMADEARSAAGRVGIHGSGPAAAQPALRPSTLQMIFQVLGGRSDVVRTVEDVVRVHAGAPELAGLAATIWREVTEKISGLTTSSVPQFLRSSRPMAPGNQLAFDLVKNHLTQTHSITPGTRQAEILGVVRTLAHDCTDEPREGRPGRFHHDRFANLVEGFIGLRTGILVDIRLHRVATESSAVSSVVVTGVDLSRIGGNSPIWDAVMHASFPSVTDEERTRRRLKIRSVLEREGPRPGMWESRAFALTESYWRRVVEQTRPPSEVNEETLSRNWPTRESFIAGTGDLSGLRLGIYRDHAGCASFGRESHHAVQYLLLEYFRNRKPTHQPFVPGAGYPWIEMAGGLSERYSGQSGQIEFAAVESGRGGSMPAILLSAETHQQSNLHIPAISFSRWDATKELAGSGTQGATVHDEYRGQLHEQLGPLAQGFQQAEQNGTVAAFIATATPRGGQPVEQLVERAMYRAIQNTYRYVYDHMVLGRLRPALVEWELPYYRRMAAMDPARVATGTATDGRTRLQPAYEVTRADMERVFSAARDHTRTTLDAHGWKVG